MARQILVNVEPEWTKKADGCAHGNSEGQTHQICSFFVGRHHWIMSHSKLPLEKMTKDLMEEAERWDLEPTASLWWTSTKALEVMEDIVISTRTGQHRILCHLSKDS